MTLGMIWAQAHDRVIGKDNDLPWHLPEDLRHFRQTTAGDAVVMGRRQWESLPERIRPLPGRRNIVLTRNRDYEAPGAEVVDNLPAALALVAGEDAWICGGAQVYEQAIAHADLLVVTEIDHAVDGDCHAPIIAGEWRLTEQDPADGGWQVAENGMRFRILTYRHPR
ncbi:dihydrofolate reductase [Georgenia sp. MJ170]|uniref:dihydrofolate reductase n=1 Tax=Georgenia sunbinii TaxID=3117728 RepID=UPI002F264D20